MESQYYEQLVSCKANSIMKIINIMSIVGLVVAVSSILVSVMAASLGIVAMGIIFWFSRRQLNKEYEYVYIEGDIAFDAVFAKSKRKSKLKVKWEEIKLVCKANAPELEGYRRKNAKVREFTSQMNDINSCYALAVEQMGNYMIVYFEPVPELLDMMWKKGPSKVKK